MCAECDTHKCREIAVVVGDVLGRHKIGREEGRIKRVCKQKKGEEVIKEGNRLPQLTICPSITRQMDNLTECTN